MHPKLTETLSKYNKIILVGGGTGGHIQPIVSIAQVLRNHNLHWIGGKDSNEEKEAKSAGISFQSISTLKLATTRSPKVLLYPFVLIRGIVEARRILKKEILASQEGQMNNSNGLPCVFSKGGPGSVAIGIAAWTLGIPLYIHESDTIPGRSNRILGKFATKIFLGFDSAKKYFKGEKCETIGQILNPVFSAKDSKSSTFQHSISWKTDKKHLLIICGSQGARVIFEEILQNLETILEKHEVILILGKLNTDLRVAFDQKIKTIRPSNHTDIQLIDWISQSDLAHLIPDTDIAITRGSATTLAELTSSGNIVLVIVPLPYAADNHQYYNALEYEKMGHILLEQKNIHLLSETLEKIGQNSLHSNI